MLASLKSLMHKKGAMPDLIRQRKAGRGFNEMYSSVLDHYSGYVSAHTTYSMWGAQGNEVNSINQPLLWICSAHLNVVLYHLHGGRQSLCLSPAVKSLIWTQLDTVDYIPWQITLQAVDKIVAISSQFKNKSHLSREIKKNERRTWHQHSNSNRSSPTYDWMCLWGQEIVSLCEVEK